jgi:hypothetical protein
VHAVSIVASDVDHDGDLDLAMATLSNQVVIWINDGQGHFTEQRPSAPPVDVLPVTTLAGDGPDEHLAVRATGAQVVSTHRSLDTSVSAARVRPPTARATIALRFLTPRSLRGPPRTTTLS